MEYKGKLYGKVGNGYFPLLKTTEYVDNMEERIKALEDGLRDIAEFDTSNELSVFKMSGIAKQLLNL